MRRSWWAWNSESCGPWPAVAFGPRARFFDFGEVRLAILSLLSEGPKHGYQLMKEMQERSGGMYRASAGSVYPTLQQLEDEGLIQSKQQEGRRVYRLTVAGKNELEKDPEGVRRIWQRAEQWEDWSQWMGPEVIAFTAPLAHIVKSTLRATKWAVGRPEREERLRAILTRACSDLDELSK